MKLSRLLTAAALAGSVSLMALTAHAQGAPKPPFTYTDMIKLDRISAVNVDTAGHYAVIQVRATDMDKNKGVNSLWLKDLSNLNAAEVKLAAGEGGASDPQWSADGKTIYFLSSRGGSSQVWKTDVAGATATQVTNLALDVGAYQPTPDGKGVVVSVAVFPECGAMGGDQDEIACTVRKQADAKAENTTGVVYTKVFVRHWDEWEDGTRNHLFYVPFDGGATVALTKGYDGDVPSKPFGDEGDFTISPDSQTVYFSGREAGKTEPYSTNFDVYSVPMAGGAIADLTAGNPAWDASPRISPDGKTMAYKAMKRPGFEADRFGLMLRDMATGATRELSPDWDRSADDVKWSKDGKSLYITAGDTGMERLFQVNAKTGVVTPISKSGHMDAFFETPKGFVFTKDSLTQPALLYASWMKTGMIDVTANPITNIDSNLKDFAWGDYEQFTFKGWNGDDVHGIVVKPANYVEGKTYPVAFLIHGGPQGSFGDDWSFRWNPETYAGAGYAVVMIDFHGSTGYGQAFEDAISQHWGDRPLEDLQKGWAAALANYKFLDGNRACALGASYGGFMADWIAGNWKDPWKCIVSHDGVFDARMMGYSTEEMWFEKWEQGADVLQDPAAYDKFNPALHAKDWSVPMLIVHSDKDYRIPVEQGIAAFTALQANGVDSEFLHFPDENHWVLKPQNSMKWHKTVFDWLDTHIGQSSLAEKQSQNGGQ